MSLKYYKTYDHCNDTHVICIEHPINGSHSLCGNVLDDNPSGRPEEVEGPLTCPFCFETIKTIMENMCSGCYVGPVNCQCKNDE